ncbi:hypothetical protein ACFU44_32470 [Nocardia rhizosphaerihabitans]
MEELELSPGSHYLESGEHFSLGMSAARALLRLLLQAPRGLDIGQSHAE